MLLNLEDKTSMYMCGRGENRLGMADSESAEICLKIFPAPSSTENDGILFTLSPSTSGTSFMRAITTPNKAKKAARKTHSGKALHAVTRSGICKPSTCISLARKNPY